MITGSPPARLEGNIWRFQVPWSAAWAVILFAIGLTVATVGHDWTGWVWGPAIALVLGAIALRVFRTRDVSIEPEGFTDRKFWRTRRFHWSEILDVTVTSCKYIGPNFTPTLTLADGATCRLLSLVARKRPRAEKTVIVLREAKERFTAS